MKKAQTQEQGTDHSQCAIHGCTNTVWNWTDFCFDHKLGTDQVSPNGTPDLTPDGFKTGSRPTLEGMGILEDNEVVSWTLNDDDQGCDAEEPVAADHVVNGKWNVTMDFIKAGKAIFTVDNGRGTHYTYKVSKKEDGDRTIWFVNLLTGPDNTSNYTYIGMLVKGQGQFQKRHSCRMTKASKMYADSRPVRVFDWAMGVVEGFREIPDGYSIQHNGRCARCARLLTDPESIRLGLGPVCRDLGF